MHPRFVIASLALALVACGGKKKEEGKEVPQPVGSAVGSGSAAGSGSAVGSGAGSAGSGSAGSAGSAAATGGPDAEEAARRAGKKLGLAEGEKPEVATEELVRAIASGKVPASRFIDPKLGVYQVLHLPGGTDKPAPTKRGRLCGEAAEKQTTEYLARLVKVEAESKDDPQGAIGCTNAFLATPDPTFGTDEMDEKPRPAVPMKHAVCGGGDLSAGEYGEVFTIEFVPDAERGLRIAALVSTEVGATAGAIRAEVAKEMSPGAKGCK